MLTYLNSEKTSGKNRKTMIKVRKRDGREEILEVKKILQAIKRCFQLNLGRTESESETIAESISKRVANIINHDKRIGEDFILDVEDIQRLVIQQLWAADLYEAAEQYTLYKERRKTERLLKARSEEEVNLIREDVKRFKEPYQYYQLVSKYVRWSYENERRETWKEAKDRVMNFFRSRPQLKNIPEPLWDELDSYLYNLQALPAMRVIQMAGPPLEICNVGAYNCSYLVIDSLDAFSEMLYILMQGTGVGFSVENRYIDRLPRVGIQKEEAKVEYYTIPDTTQGWCEALRKGITNWFKGQDVIYDYNQIRPAGSILKTKGGRASGAEPLKQLLVFVRKVILSRQGKRLTPLDCHDIACMIGKIVQVGGVRRSSEISLSDLSDSQIRGAKCGNWWEDAPWRSMANNSAVYEEKPSAVEFLNEWLSLATSGSGERGIFNREAANRGRPKRRKNYDFGTNPCAEIILRPKEFCNLSIAVARPEDTFETLAAKVRVATIFGTIQATLTNFNYISKEWKENCEEERLLGVDITGQLDCPLLRPGHPDREELVKKLKEIVIETNKEISALLGINPCAAGTCVKPSGNSSQFLDCGSGLHTRYGEYIIRRFRGSVNDPVSKLLRDEGVPCHFDPMNDSLLVFEFPVKSPSGTPTRHDMTAIDMLENWLFWKKNWAEHSVSCTIYVDKNEWVEVGNWVYQHFDEISGL